MQPLSFFPINALSRPPSDARFVPAQTLELGQPLMGLANGLPHAIGPGLITKPAAGHAGLAAAEAEQGALIEVGTQESDLSEGERLLEVG